MSAREKEIRHSQFAIPNRRFGRGLAALWWLALAASALLLAGCPEQLRNVLVVSRENFTAPDPPQVFLAEASATAVLLTWSAPTTSLAPADANLQGFLFVRGEGKYPNAMPVRGTSYQPGDALGDGGVVLANFVPTALEYNDTAVATGSTYYYEGFSYDAQLNYSQSARLSSTPGSMVYARLSHTQTTLADERVLLAGGLGAAGPLNVAEIFDPSTSAFAPVQRLMFSYRFAHTATLLPDGTVLLVGGYEQGFADVLKSAEQFDPDTEVFSALGSELTYGRASHTATAAPDGRVLIVGGTDGVNALDSIEIYDPTTQQFSVVGDTLPTPRYGHVAALVGDSVVILGGFDGFKTVAKATVIHLDTLRVSDLNNIPQAESPMPVGALDATITALPGGEWLLAGGFSGAEQTGTVTAAALLFTPAASPYFATTGSLLAARSGHVAALLPDGTALICGGIALDQSILDSSEIYNATSGEFRAGATMTSPRTVAAVTLLPDGRPLITGGNRSVDMFSPDPVSTAEAYDPATSEFHVVVAGAQ